MTTEIKQSTTTYPLCFLMVDSTDHVTGKTGLTCTVTLSKAGAAFGAAAGAVTEIANGWYKVAGNATDNNTLGPLLLHASATGADPTDKEYNVTARLADDLAYPATSGRSMVVDVAGLVDANMVKLGPTGSGTAQTARDVGANVLLSSGTGTGQLDFTTGVVKANLAQILGTALTETAGQIAAAFKKFFDKSSPTGTVNSIPDAVAGAANGLVIAGANAATTFATLTSTGAMSINGTSTVAQTGDNYARLGAPAGASVSADVAAIKAVLPAALGANGNIKADVRDFGGTAGTFAAGRPEVNVNGLTASDVGTIKTKTDSLTFTVAGMVDSNVVDWKGATAPAMTGDAYARLGAPAGASVSADVAAVKAVLPAALVSGRIDASVGAMAANVLTATAIAADAITDAKVASDVTIASVTGSVASVTGNVGGNVVGSVGSVTGLTASDVGAIKAKTDNLPSDPADASDIATATTAIYGRLGAPAGVSMSADIAAVKSDTGAIKTKTDFLPSVTAGAAGGLFIAGSNAATTAASLTVTGELAIGDGVDITVSTTDRPGFKITGNGLGTGLLVLGGDDAEGIYVAGGTDQNAVSFEADGTGTGLEIASLGLGVGMSVEGNSGLQIFGHAGVALTVQQQDAGAGLQAILIETASVDGDAVKIAAAGSGKDLSAKEIDAILATTNKLDDTVEDAGSDNWIFTVDALANAPTGGGGGYTPSQIADEVQTRTIAAVTVVNGLAANTVTASALASDAVTEIQSGLATSSALAAVQSDTDDIQSRLPAALVSGRMDSSVGAMAANVLTATAIAADAITDAKVASDVTIASVTGSVGSVTGLTTSDVGAIKAKTDNLPSDPADQSLVVAATTAIYDRLGAPSGASMSVDIAAVQTYVGLVKTVTDKLDDTLEDDGGTYRFTANALEEAPTGGGGGYTPSQIADEVQTRTIAAVTVVNGLAANTVTASALASDAVTEIQSGLATSSALAAVQSDTDNIQTRLPTSLVSGRMDSSVGAMASDVMTASALASSAVAEIQSGLATDTALATVNSTVNAIKAKTDNLPSDPADASDIAAATASIYSRLGAPAGASMSADIAAVKVDTAAIKTKTDAVVFTGGNKVQVDIKAVNGTTVAGNGSPGTEWGPA